MRFLTVADRELRSAARQKATYRTRWITASVFFLLLVWLLWVFGGFTNKRAAPEIFRVFAVLTFLYCLFISTARTADCISVERREGTLGLLFLTNLNSAEIIAGKLCSTALASVYGLMAVFPMLALPLLMGGVTFGNFARTVVGLLNGILFSLAAGFLTSVLCRKQFTAVALAMGTTLAFSVGLLLGSVAANAYLPTKPFAHWLSDFSPLCAIIAADDTRGIRSNRFWFSVAAVAGISVVWLGLTTLLLARTWRDRARNIRSWPTLRFGRRSERLPSARRAALRRRLLGINPLFWLAGRQQVSAPVFMLIAVILTLVTAYIAAPAFGRIMMSGTASPVLGHLFAWLWTGLAIHALVLYYAAMSASQRLAEDKQTGSLELILSTPISEQTIRRGLWLAFARKMLFPALLAVMVHIFFFWICMEMATLDPPGDLPPGAQPGEIFWAALLDHPIRGVKMDWEFGFMLRCGSFLLLLLMICWPTLGCVGRWLGLRMKHPGFAPITSLAVLAVPPVLLFSLACYLAGKVNLYRLPERQWLPMLLWVALGIGIAHCITLSLWATGRLRGHLRSVAMSRYQPLPGWRWHLPSARTVRRFATAAAILAVAVSSLVGAYYGYHTWHSTREWRSFTSSLKRSGDSIDLAPLLPAPAPNGSNFVRSPAFVGLLSKTNAELTALFRRTEKFDVQMSVNQGNYFFLDWTHQGPASLAALADPNAPPAQIKQRSDYAAALLQDLQPQDKSLRELASAAARFPAFQVSANRNAFAVLGPVHEEMRVLERLHLLFQARACALLEAGRNAEAAEDVSTGFRLVQFARQLPGASSSLRVRMLVTRSLQPVWEGLSHHAWTEPQLAGFQRELAGFDLLADFTNSVRQVVAAHIEAWRAIPGSTNLPSGLVQMDGVNMNDTVWRLQPRAWWFDACIQLHTAGRRVLEKVDVAGCRVSDVVYWTDLNGLPLDAVTRDLLQQARWRGATPTLVAFAQTAINQATIACALERFRLAKGNYPKSLDELVPGLLPSIPRDAICGRPIIYQALEDGTFMLRGVGPNEKDDRDQKVSDDWLWAYTTNKPNLKK